MIVSLEDFITKKIALSTANFPNESIKAVIDEIKSEGELDWITPDAEQSFFTCDDRPRYLFIQFNLMKDPQLNWSSVLFTNFKVYSLLDLSLTPLVEEPYWFGDTIVECKNCSHCQAIYKYLKRENENAEN